MLPTQKIEQFLLFELYSKVLSQVYRKRAQNEKKKTKNN